MSSIPNSPSDRSRDPQVSNRILIFSCTNHAPSHPPSAVAVRSIVNRPSSPAINRRPSRIVQYRSQPAPQRRTFHRPET
jgi:hypothetical protein